MPPLAQNTVRATPIHERLPRLLAALGEGLYERQDALRLGLLAALYSFYLLYTGLPVLMKSAPDKSLPYTAVVVVAGIATAIIAMTNPDPVLDRSVAPTRTTAPSDAFTHAPAGQARNHATTATVPVKP